MAGGRWVVGGGRVMFYSSYSFPAGCGWVGGWVVGGWWSSRQEETDFPDGGSSPAPSPLLPSSLLTLFLLNLIYSCHQCLVSIDSPRNV